MSTRKEIREAKLEQAFWNDVTQALGEGYVAIGWTFYQSATIRDPAGIITNFTGGIACRILELAGREVPEVAKPRWWGKPILPPDRPRTTTTQRWW